MKKLLFSLFILLLTAYVLGMGKPVRAQSEANSLELVNAKGDPISTIVDGSRIRLGMTLLAPASQELSIQFFLEEVVEPVAECRIQSNQDHCQSDLVTTLGWYWDASGVPYPERIILAAAGGQSITSQSVSIEPRPVVLVHGFNSNWETWLPYIDSAGFLAGVGLHGYAVGDGQVAGVMDTGGLADPFGRTNTIAQNAEILSQYITNVKQATGAEQVDLVVHSMGGMISRFYLDRVMADRDVAQLIILGTPMAGSSCANLPAALGILLPATLEIMPDYMVGIFNQQITHRRGVPFYALAGTKLLEAVQSPCTAVPSDLVVTFDSVKAIEMPVNEIALLHMDLNTSPEAFRNFVLPLLQTPPGKFEDPADPIPKAAPGSTQFSRVFTGHVNPGETKEVTIQIDSNVKVANFALYDTTRSLVTEVTGASGKVITLDNIKNGLVVVDDPEVLFYLGYGFTEPAPGKWVVKLQTTQQTPAGGADFAIMAQFDGGGVLEASAEPLLPEVNQVVLVSASLAEQGSLVQIETAEAILRHPDGTVERFPMELKADGTAEITIRPKMEGVFSVETAVTAKDASGMIIERGQFVIFQAQPTDSTITTTQALVVFAAALLLVGGVWLLMRRRRTKMK